MFFEIILGCLIPLFGTVLGSACVFFMRRELDDGFRRAISGIAAGVMVAASVWSLLIPAMEYESSVSLGRFAFLPATLGVWFGILFLVLTSSLLSRINEGELLKKAKRSFGESSMLFTSVTLHNLPEGMAVGVVYAALIAAPSGEALGGALALSIGIAIQNFPEGAIISMPLRAEGMKKCKAFWYGVASGIVEPIGAALTLLAVSVILPILPFLLGFAAGAMIYAVVKELMPFVSGRGESGAVFFALGFSIMMILDVIFG
jgi:ZIP family zinc transporter